MPPAPCYPKRAHSVLESNALTETSLRFVGDVVAVDALLEDRRRLEHHRPARRNRNFLAGLGIAPNALTFFAHDERTERGQLYGFATLEAVGDLLEHQLHQRGGFGA